MAPDVTVCIPTLERPMQLLQTLERVLTADCLPGTILVSEAARLPEARRVTTDALARIPRPPLVTVRLLDQPPNGQRCGNRNWLARHVKTEFLMFVDDDVDTPSSFVSDALPRLRSRAAAIVVAASEEVGGAGWLTHRGHFRPARPGEPIAVGFQLAIWRTSLFKTLWLDENIVYGSEESDISVRLYADHPRTICSQANVLFHDRGRHLGPSTSINSRLKDAERSRCYVAVRRYYRSRIGLMVFLLHEVAANTARLRRPLPSGLVSDQWRPVFLYLLGGPVPGWILEPRVEADSEWPAQAAD